MKLLLPFLTIVFTLANLTSIGQNVLGNAWINPENKYLKIKVAENGVYRITSSQITAAGLDISNVQGKDFQLWNLGKQQPIFVSKEATFSNDGYIDFIGEKHTLGLDTFLFENWQEDLFNIDYSLVTDTNIYFLTLSPNTPNLRIETVIPDFDEQGVTDLDYYIHQEKILFTNTFIKVVAFDLQYSNFEPNEGFGDIPRRVNNIELKTSDFIDKGISPQLNFRYGNSIFQSALVAKVNGRTLDTVFSTTKKTVQRSYALTAQDIKNTVELNLTNINQNDQHRLSAVNLKYTRKLNFENKSSYLFETGNSTGKYALNINNFKHDDQDIYIYSKSSNKRFLTMKVGNSGIRAVLENNDSNDFYIVNQSQGIIPVENISLFTPQIFEESDADYLIITHPKLRSASNDPIAAYAEYRSSMQGGSHQVAIVEIQDIYNHFGYGIDRHFYAIKNFSTFLKQKWENLEHVFIIGKGVDYSNMRIKNDIEKYDERNFFIPSYGYPASDNMLFSEGNYANPEFALGRLAAINAAQVRDYLDKTIAYETAQLSGNQTIEDQYWKKRILHLSGGGKEFEQSSIRGWMNSLANIIQNSYKGAEVFSYYKTSTDVLQSVAIDQINSLINSGINMITFFGHSAPGTWDFNLEDPSKYKNFGKYPFINSLGCYSGNIHVPIFNNIPGISERFVLIKDKGAIGFIASSGTANITQLGQFASEQYHRIGTEQSGKSVGIVHRDMAKKYREVKSNTYAFYQQLTLHCDPAIKIYYDPTPDYTFDFGSVKTNPSIISSSTKEIEFEFSIVNLGKGKQDSLNLVFYQQLPSGEIFDTINLKIDAPFYKKTYKFTFNNAGVNGIGKNTIFGKIDPQNLVDEQPNPEAKNNNELKSATENGYSFYILDNTAFPIDPCEYAIVNNPDIVLRASTSNALVKNSNYLIQIDTTELFNSPLKQQEKLMNAGGLLEWKPTLLFSPNTVYYWRVSPDSISPEVSYLWQKSSFIYLPNSTEGWNQSHYFQYADNNAPNKINIDENRVHKFPEIDRILTVKNGIWEQGVNGYIVDQDNPSASIRPWAFMDKGGMAVAIYDGVRQTHITNSGGEFGSVFSTATASTRCFGFWTDTPQEREKLVNFLENNIPDDHYVSVFTVITKNTQSIFAEDWANDETIYGNSIMAVLEKNGAEIIREITQKGTVPYTLMFRKNNGVIRESMGDNIFDSIEDKMFIPRPTSEGVLQTKVIGPALSWKELNLSQSNIENKDTTWVSVFGIKTDKTEDTLYDNLITTKIDLTSVDAKIYPFIRVELFIRDEDRRTPPKLQYIRVNFEKIIDYALDPKQLYTFYNDTLDQGDILKFSVALKNLNQKITDSIEVKYSIVSLEDNSEVHQTTWYKGSGTKDTINLSFQYNTRELLGDYVFVAEANPNRTITERQYFNNIGKKEFKVKPDLINPLMDVYFDGIKIMDGDIVSPKPEIKISLIDNNPFLLLDDKDLFEVKLDTGRNQFRTVDMNSSEIKFEPATAENKEAVLRYYPSLKSGQYKLVVQAKDASGNLSGINNKAVNFTVIEEQSITQVLNYPNPFSTSTQFVFTLTGEEEPENFSISILTMSGKVVREISKEELGPLRIGVNRTQFKWDGTDEYGEKLANGVYLYKANIRNNKGEEYKTMSHKKIDQFFTEGYGKLVILR